MKQLKPSRASAHHVCSTNIDLTAATKRRQYTPVIVRRSQLKSADETKHFLTDRKLKLSQLIRIEQNLMQLVKDLDLEDVNA